MTFEHEIYIEQDDMFYKMVSENDGHRTIKLITVIPQLMGEEKIITGVKMDFVEYGLVEFSSLGDIVDALDDTVVEYTTPEEIACELFANRNEIAISTRRGIPNTFITNDNTICKLAELEFFDQLPEIIIDDALDDGVMIIGYNGNRVFDRTILSFGDILNPVQCYVPDRINDYWRKLVFKKI